MECPKCHVENSEDSHFCRVCGADLDVAVRISTSGPQPGYGPHRTFVPGSTFAGRYQILEELGRGGMGIVYKAEDTKLKRCVALKFLPWELTRSAEAKERFLHEAQAASSLDHVSICAVHEIDETVDGQLYISMGCYDGETLKGRIGRGPLSVDEASDFGIQVAEGLREAHEKGIVHRDIKPSNIMITDKGQAKIMDFGLAKLAGQTKITKVGTTLGTVAYMSPEQARGEDVDHRTDIWSLGVVLYEMVTGRLPFRGEYDQAVIYSILNADAYPLRESGIEIPSGFEDIITRCLSKNADERYQSASDLEVALKQFGRDSDVGMVAAGSRIGVRPPAWSSLRRVGIPIAVAAFLAVLLVVYGPGRRVFRASDQVQTAGVPGLVAVLPCNLVGGTAEDRAMCDGMAKVLTDKLVYLEQSHEGFQVVGRGDVGALKSKSPAEAWKHFGASVAITGDLRVQQDRFELVLVRNDTESQAGSGTEILRQRRSQRIADPIANLSTWQDSIVAYVANLLDLPLLGPDRDRVFAGGTTVPGAYISYLRAMGYMYPYEANRDMDAAIESFQRAVDLDPSYAAAYAELGYAYYRRFRKTKDRQWADLARAAGESAVRNDDTLARGYAVLGYVDRASGDYESAIKHFTDAIAVDSTDDRNHDGLAYVYELMGDFARAEFAYKKAIELRPQIANTYNELGTLYYRQGRYEEAIEPFSQITKLKPMSTVGYNMLGVAYFELDRLGEAKSVYEKSLEIKPTYGACSNLGTIYFTEARYADAAAMYAQALEISDTYYRIWGNLGESYHWCPGEQAKAIAHFRRAVELGEEALQKEPLNPTIISDLASYYGCLGEHPRAKALLADIVGLEQTDPLVLFKIAETYELMGEHELALDWMEAALDHGASSTKADRFPGLRRLRSDPRYQELLDRTGQTGSEQG
jgi:serine/threonine-protein kinase